MTNITLNIGGFIGALAGGGIATGIIIATHSDNFDRAPIRLVIVALIAGAFAGNFLWALIFRKNQ